MSAPAPSNPFSIESLVSKAIKMLGVDVPNPTIILSITAQLAELVNKAPGLHGPEKAALVQRVLREILNSSVVRSKLTDAEVNTLNIIIDTVVPTTLTLLISAGRGEFDLKKPRQTLLWCCKTAASVIVAAIEPEVKEPTPTPIVAHIETEVKEPVVSAPEEVKIEQVLVVANSVPIESNEIPSEIPVAPSSN